MCCVLCKKVSKKENFFLFFEIFSKRIFFLSIDLCSSTSLHFHQHKNTTTNHHHHHLSENITTQQKNDALFSVVEKSALFSLRDDDDIDEYEYDFISFFEDERVCTFYEYKSYE